MHTKTTVVVAELRQNLIRYLRRVALFDTDTSAHATLILDEPVGDALRGCRLKAPGE